MSTSTNQPKKTTRAESIGRLLLPAAFVSASILAYAGGGFQLGQWAPFAIGFLLVAAIAMVFVPIERARFGGKLRIVTLAALAGYVVWSVITISWSPNKFAAHEEAVRTALFAACILIGMIGSRWRSSIQFAIAAWVVTTSAIAAVMLKQLASHQDHYFAGGRLLGTLTYHNAEAALLAMPIPAALSIAALRQVSTEVRTLLVAGSSFLAMIAVLPQSRGSLIGIAIAMLVTLAASPARTRLVIVCAPVVASVVLAWPRLNAVFAYRQANPDTSSAQQINAAISTIVGITAIVVVVMLAATLLDRARQAPLALRRTTSVVVLVLCITAFATALTASPKLRSPIDTIRTEWNAAAKNQPTAKANPDDLQTGRFAQMGNGSAAARIVLWRVAVDDFKDSPVRGIGIAQYEPTFYIKRTQMLDRYARQPHQLTLEVLAERGIIGALLFSIIVIGVAVNGIRARVNSKSMRSKAIVAGLLGTCAYWLTHAQLDWIWQVEALTIPAALAAGCLLGAPWRLPRDPSPISIRGRVVLIVCIISVLAAVVPLAISNREVDHANDALNNGDAHLALIHAKRATNWAPHSMRAWQLLANARLDLGNRRAADTAARRSVREDKNHWAAYVWLADYYDQRGNVDGAVNARIKANALNPLDPDLTSS